MAASSSVNTVVPRVIPIFIREVTSATTPAVQREHITSLTACLADVFNSRVLDDDVGDLVSCLLSIAKVEADTEAKISQKSADVAGSGPSSAAVARARAGTSSEDNILLTVVPDTLGFHILRLFMHMFDLKELHAARCFRAMKKLSEGLTRRRAIEAEKEANRAALTYTTAAAASSQQPQSQSQYNGPSTANPSTAVASFVAFSYDDVLSHPHLLHMDALLANDSTRRMVLRLWREWDGSGVDLEHFTAAPERLHLYVPQRNATKMRVFRDFCFCTPRPKMSKEWGSVAACHIKTNIPKRSDIMYRILVEGYNYGVNAVIFSDVVGYTNRNWETITDLEQYGWPKGWDAEMANDYAPGVAISQYYSADGFLVVRLRAKSMFCIGFSVSGWLVFHGFGAGYPITATISHQDDDL